MAISEEIREQERVAAIHWKRDEIKAKLERIDEVSKIYPSPGLSNQAALLNSELKNLGY